MGCLTAIPFDIWRPRHHPRRHVRRPLRAPGHRHADQRQAPDTRHRRLSRRLRRPV